MALRPVFPLMANPFVNSVATNHHPSPCSLLPAKGKQFARARHLRLTRRRPIRQKAKTLCNRRILPLLSCSGWRSRRPGGSLPSSSTPQTADGQIERSRLPNPTLPLAPGSLSDGPTRRGRQHRGWTPARRTPPATATWACNRCCARRNVRSPGRSLRTAASSILPTSR